MNSNGSARGFGPRHVCCAVALCWLVAVGGCGGDDDGADQVISESAARLDIGHEAVAGDSVATGYASLPLPTAAESTTGTSPAAPAPAPEAAEHPAAVPAQAPPTASTDPAPVAAAPRAPATGNWTLQLGSYRREANARGRLETLRQLGYAAETETVVLEGETYHRVLLRGFADKADARRTGEDIRRATGDNYLIMRRP